MPGPAVGPGGASSSNSFQDYQESVSDAWDLGDDEFCIISGTVDPTTARISKKVSHSAALNVIKTHRSSSGSGVERGTGRLTEVSVHRGSSGTGGGTTVTGTMTVVESLDGLKIDRSVAEKALVQRQPNYEALNHVNENR